MSATPAKISRIRARAGRRGGKARVAKGFASLTAKERSVNAKAAAAKRWA